MKASIRLRLLMASSRALYFAYPSQWAIHELMHACPLYFMSDDDGDNGYLHNAIDLNCHPYHLLVLRYHTMCTSLSTGYHRLPGQA